MHSRRRFIAISAAAVTAFAVRHAAGQTPTADPLTGAVNMAQRTIGTGFSQPDTAFDMAASDTGEYYYPQFAFGVTAYTGTVEAITAFTAWSDHLSRDPGRHYDDDGDLVPRADREPFAIELDTDQVAAWRQPWETTYPDSQAFDAVWVLAQQDATVHLWQVTPGKSGDFGPVEDLLLTLAAAWLPAIDGAGTFDRDALFALLPGEEQLSTLPGFWRTFAIDDDYGETNR